MQVIDLPNTVGLSVIKRDGNVVMFDAQKVELAIKKCAVDVLNGNLSSKHHEVISEAVNFVCRAVTRQGAATVHIEAIQDAVELALMRAGEHQLARGYVLFREAQAQKRASKDAPVAAFLIVDAAGQKVAFDAPTLLAQLKAEIGFVDVEPIVTQVMKEVFNGATAQDLRRSVLMVARSLI